MNKLVPWVVSTVFCARLWAGDKNTTKNKTVLNIHELKV